MLLMNLVVFGQSDDSPCQQRLQALEVGAAFACRFQPHAEARLGQRHRQPQQHRRRRRSLRDLHSNMLIWFQCGRT